MNGGAPVLVESKLHVPRPRPGTVARARLEDRLDPDALPSVTVVSAPAGSGKTTLVARWVHTAAARGGAVAWVGLDRRDGDPVSFWTYLIAAVERAVPGVLVGAAAQLAAGGSPDEVAVAVANDLTRLDGDLIVVLDDYHCVDTVVVHASVETLIGALPEHVHLVIAGRADPPWPLSGLRVGGRLLEIRAADLHFTADEAATYLHGSMGLELTAADVDSLVTRTEGWVAALQLAAITLQGRDDPGAFVAGFAGDDRYVMDYLLDEVLDRQSTKIREFLLRTSVLSRLSASLAAAVTGTADAAGAAELLRRIDRANLFLVALDDRRRWFRYHHLFAEVLRTRLAEEHPDEVADVHRRAADWFEAEGDLAEAFDHALAAGRVDQAAKLAELATPELRRTRQDATLQRRLDALPTGVFATRPVLNLARVGARMVRGDPTGVADLLDDIDAWTSPDHRSPGPIVHDTAEFARLPAQSAMYRAGLAMLEGDVADAIAHGRRAGDLAAPDDHAGRGAAAALVGIARWTGGDLDAATGEYRRAIDEFTAAGHFADVLGCSLGLADQLVGLGRLGAAEAVLTAALDVADAHGPLRGTADMHVGLAAVHLERGDDGAAAGELAAAREVGDHLALAQYAYRWRVVEGRLLARAGDRARALTVLEDAERHYDTDYSPKVQPAAAGTARARVAAGDLDPARRWAVEAGVTATDPPGLLREYELLTLVRLLLAEHATGDAVALAAGVLGDARRGGRTGTVAEAALLLALAHDAEGARDEAVAWLGVAVDAAAPERQFGMFVDAPDPLAGLLDAMIREGTSVAHGRDLQRALRRPTRPVAPVAGVPDDALSDREVEVLRWLRSELTGPEIAAELYISLNTFRTHTRHIFTKLDVTNRRAAVARADDLGL